MAKDPICSMEVDESTGLKLEHEGQTYYFCSPACRDKFLAEKGKPAPSSEAKMAQQAGKIGPSTEKLTLSITGMHCASCASSIESSLKSANGVSKAAVNFATEKAYVEYDPAKITREELEQAIERAGFGVLKQEVQTLRNAGYTAIEETTADREREVRQREIRTLKIKLTVAAAFSLPLLYLAMGHHVGLPLPSLTDGSMALIQLLLATPIVAAGYQFYTVGLRTVVKSRRASMDTLVALGTGTAYLYSLASSILIWSGNSDYGMDDLYYEVAGLLIAFILLGRLLEAIAKGRTSISIRKLLGLQPKTALVIRDEQERELPVEEVVVDDVVIVKPGSAIPVDGVIVDGASSVDQSLLTGESIPIEKNVGNDVIGGTMNKEGWLKVKATRVGADTALAQIVRLVEEAQGSKAPVQRLADRVSAYFVPAVLAIGIITFLAWYLSGASLAFSLTAFIAVIIIACPCALGLATPTAVIVGIGKGAENGILIKDAATLERACKIDTVVFDKTGTLTRGKPEVTDIVSLDKSYTGDDILKLAAAVEQRSEHHLSDAILTKAKEKGMSILQVDDFHSIPGKGVEARYNNEAVLVANRRLLADKGIDVTAIEKRISQLEEEGKTVVLVAMGDKVVGMIALADTAKEFAAETVAWLKQRGKQVIMITGDNRRSAENIASRLGIDQVLSEVLPEDKATVIRKLQDQVLRVAMVGDGVNDAPALVQADVGVAIGSGTDVAIESGTIVLVKDDLRDVARTLELSRYTMRKIKQNLFWAFFYNSVGIPIAAGILYPFYGYLLNPIIAGAAMAFSSVSVVTNSLSMRRYNVGKMFR